MDEYLSVMIYKGRDEGTIRINCSTTDTPTYTQRKLYTAYKKGLKTNSFNSMAPGRYQFKFTKIRRYFLIAHTEAFLINIDENESKLNG
jgi:hypothetical protein